MSNQELPPWMELPPEVRARVSERFNELFPERPVGDPEKPRQELIDLGICRLVEMHGGDIPKAIAFARGKVAGREILQAIGDKESDWIAAIARCQDTLKRILGDENELHRGLVIQQLVAEELAAFRSRN